MLKSEVFEKALQEVVAQTEISRERILSQETCVEVVDARHILMYIIRIKRFQRLRICKDNRKRPPYPEGNALPAGRNRISSKSNH